MNCLHLFSQRVHWILVSSISYQHQFLYCIVLCHTVQQFFALNILIDVNFSSFFLVHANAWSRSNVKCWLYFQIYNIHPVYTLCLSHHCIFHNNIKMCWLRTLYAFSYFYEKFYISLCKSIVCYFPFISLHRDRLSYIFAGVVVVFVVAHKKRLHTSPNICNFMLHLKRFCFALTEHI